MDHKLSWLSFSIKTKNNTWKRLIETDLNIQVLKAKRFINSYYIDLIFIDDVLKISIKIKYTNFLTYTHFNRLLYRRLKKILFYTSSDITDASIKKNEKEIFEKRFVSEFSNSQFNIHFRPYFFKILSGLLSETELPVENIFITLAYLHLVWIKKKSEICNENVALTLMKGYGGVQGGADIKGKQEMAYAENLYTKNESRLKEIYYEVFGDLKPSTERVPDIDEWAKCCEEYLRMNNNIENKNLSEIVYYYIPQLISSPIGKNGELRNLLFYMISRLFLDFE